MNFNFIRNLFFISVCIACTQVISAQDWLTFTTQNSGLPSNYITCIEPASDGKYWIGTDSGAAVYDWNSWVVFDSTNSGIPNSFILEIEEDSKGDIWIGSTIFLFEPDTLGGLARFNGNTWQLYTINNSGIAGTYNHILAAAPDSSIWISTWPWTLSGYCINQNFDGANWYTFAPPQGDFEPREFIVDSDNVLWIGGTDEGLGKFYGSSLLFYGPQGRILSDITIDPAANKWMTVNCCPNKEIIKYDGVSFTSYPLPFTPAISEGLNCITADHLGNIWVGTTAYGLLKFDGQNWQIIDTSNSLIPDNFINHLVVDQHNNLWMKSGNTLTVYNESGIVTPVELASFTAEVSEYCVNLFWSTATETNNRGFFIEKSKGDNWETIDFIDGSGTTADLNTYNYKDPITASGTYKYRLKQVDYDGSHEYSDEVEVTVGLPKEYLLMQNYPNPFNPVTTIKYSVASEGLVNLSVFNLLGQKVAELKNEVLHSGYYETKFDASSLSSGVYVYKLSVAGKVISRKMVVLK